MYDFKPEIGYSGVTAGVNLSNFINKADILSVPCSSFTSLATIYYNKFYNILLKLTRYSKYFTTNLPISYEDLHSQTPSQHRNKKCISSLGNLTISGKDVIFCY